MFVITLILSFLETQRPRIINIETPNRTDVKVPLTNFKVDVEISGNTAQANYTLTYQNTENNTLVEAKLIFPFDTDVSVSDISLSYKNRTLVGQIMKSSDAKVIYDNEKEDKNVAMLVRRVGDFISIDLAGIEPNETFSAKVTTFSKLDLKFEYKKEHFFTRYVFPTSMVPRYAPAHSGEESGNPNLASTVNYTFDFNLRTTDGQISSESVSLFQSDSKGKIEWNDKSLSYTGEVPNDVVFDIITESPVNSTTVTIESYENSDVTEILIPGSILSLLRKSENRRSKSFVFLIDRSGSMWGTPIKNAQSALELFLHSLPPNSSFEVVGFGSRYSALFNGLVEYNDTTLERAVEYAKSISADFGGTEMLKPLEYILPMMPDHLIFLTDGAVSNVDEVKSYCARFSTHISTIAIGDAAASDLLRTIARQSGGTYELVKDAEQIEGSVIRSLSAMQNGFMVNSIRTNCGHLYQSFPVFLLPETVTPIYFFNENSHLSSEKVAFELTIQDISSGDEFNLTIDSSKDKSIIVNQIEGKKLHCVSLLRAINEQAINDDEAFNQSMRYNLMTKQTSFILVDKSLPNDQKHIYQTESVEIPVKTQFMGVLKHNIGRSVLFNAFTDTAAAAEAFIMPEKSSSIFGSRSKQQAAATFSPKFKQRKSKVAPNDEKQMNKCSKISALQKAGGNWLLNDVLNALDIKLNENDENDWIVRNDDDRKQLLAGLFAIRYLEKNGGDLYKLVVKKGMDFISQKYSDEMIGLARNIISNYLK